MKKKSRDSDLDSDPDQIKWIHKKHGVFSLSYYGIKFLEQEAFTDSTEVGFVKEVKLECPDETETSLKSDLPTSTKTKGSLYK